MMRPHFCLDNDVVAGDAAHGCSEPPFGFAAAVEGGGVEEADAAFVAAMHCLVGFGVAEGGVEIADDCSAHARRVTRRLVLPTGAEGSVFAVMKLLRVATRAR